MVTRPAETRLAPGSLQVPARGPGRHTAVTQSWSERETAASARTGLRQTANLACHESLPKGASPHAAACALPTHRTRQPSPGFGMETAPQKSSTAAAAQTAAALYTAMWCGRRKRRHTRRLGTHWARQTRRPAWLLPYPQALRACERCEQGRFVGQRRPRAPRPTRQWAHIKTRRVMSGVSTHSAAWAGPGAPAEGSARERTRAVHAHKHTRNHHPRRDSRHAKHAGGV